jgi:hypothetical protein
MIITALLFVIESKGKRSDGVVLCVMTIRPRLAPCSTGLKSQVQNILLVAGAKNYSKQGQAKRRGCSVCDDNTPTPCALLNWSQVSSAKYILLVAGAKNYSTKASHVVSHRTTDFARKCLSSQIERDAEFSPLYGRRYPLARVLFIIFSAQTEAFLLQLKQ